MYLEYKNFRIRTADDLNLVVEEYKTSYSPRKKETVSDWRFSAFYSRLDQAATFVLNAISNRADTKTLKELQSCVTEAKSDLILEIKSLRENKKTNKGPEGCTLCIS